MIQYRPRVKVLQFAALDCAVNSWARTDFFALQIAAVSIDVKLCWRFVFTVRAFLEAVSATDCRGWRHDLSNRIVSRKSSGRGLGLRNQALESCGRLNLRSGLSLMQLVPRRGIVRESRII